MDMAARWLAPSLALSLTVVSAAGGQPATPSATVIADALRTHLRGERFSPLTTVAALPAGLRQALSELFNAPTLDMADPGAPFQATDVMVAPRLPARRLVAAGCSADHCLVYYERGGFAHVHQIVLFGKADTAFRFVEGGVAPGGLADLEQVKDALMSGKIVAGRSPGDPGTFTGTLRLVRSMTTQTARPLRPLRRMIPLVCVTGLLLPALAGAQAPAAANAPSQIDAVDALVQKSMQLRQFPAASIAVIKDGRVIVAKGYGLADVEKSIKATDQTVYQLASVTKPFTAMATLMLVEDGKLSLDGKVTDILPGLPAAWSPVTVRHLLTHTSGIRSYTEAFGEHKVTNSQVFTHDQILALVKDAPLQFAPGDRFAYCNTGYFLLGMIIEKVSGTSYGTFLAERIFKPLGMTSTSLDDYADARPVRARGYNTANGQTTVAEHTHPSQPFAAGALVSNVLDMAKWDAALSARKLLKPASYDAMWTPMRFNDGKTSAYAFGWQVDPFRGHPRQAHGGGITGFSTFVARLPDDKVTVIVLTNQTGGAGQSLADALVELLCPR